MPALILFCIALAFVAYQAIRRPVLRRLALRDALRRPTETALVVIGSLLGTALITGSFIVGDTLDASIRATATTQLGPVDEKVDAPDLATAKQLERNLAELDDPRIGFVTVTSVDTSPDLRSAFLATQRRVRRAFARVARPEHPAHGLRLAGCLGGASIRPGPDWPRPVCHDDARCPAVHHHHGGHAGRPGPVFPRPSG